jgi:hypothetical protein
VRVKELSVMKRREENRRREQKIYMMEREALV